MSSQLKQRILRLLDLKGSLSAGTVAMELGEQGGMRIDLAATVVLDDGVSEPFATAWLELMREDYVVPDSQGAAAVFCITNDGGPSCKFPVAKDPSYPYKRPHWWPMTFRVTSAGRSWLLSSSGG